MRSVVLIALTILLGQIGPIWAKPMLPSRAYPTAGYGPLRLIAADLNEDGYLDLVSRTAGSVVQQEPGGLEIFLGRGDGSFDSSFLLLGSGQYGVAEEHLEGLGDDLVMFKLTLPSDDNFYADLVNHDNVLKVVALSGGYSRTEANARLAANNGVIASFSRALTEGLSAQQSDDEFNATLDDTVGAIAEASRT